MHDFEVAKDKVMMGAERRSRVISEEDKRHTAYHEAGHAIVAALTPKAIPLHKVTIIPRGMALGLTTFLPQADQVDMSKDQAQALIAVAMGGRVADEVFLGEKTAGASQDIERATDIARRMVCDWGMSELGPVAFGKKEEQIFLGREIAQHRDYSEATAIRIDEEVRRIVEHGYQRALEIINERKQAVQRITDALLEREVLDAAEVKLLIDGEPLPPMRNAATAKPPTDETKTQPQSAPGLTPGPQPA
jgi:cell division protease FtsH